MKRLGALLGTAVVAAVLAAAPTDASADSAVISASDAGAGQMHVVAEVTSTECDLGGAYCAWFSFAVERHPSLPCVEDEDFLMGVGDRDENAGTIRKEWTYEPFFPGQDKICVFVDNGLGVHPVGEAVISLPSGYGRQYSTAHNCSYFSSQRRAQYYLELYPSDPSELDADHDGQACEDNRCPCGAEAIPAQPIPAPPPAPVIAAPAPIFVPNPPPTLCAEGEAAVVRSWEKVTRARQTMRLSAPPRLKYHRRQVWERDKRKARQIESRHRQLCS
jgi:Excalibur calcium-binding domain